MEPPTLRPSLHKHACHHLVLVTWTTVIVMITVLLAIARQAGLL